MRQLDYSEELALRIENVVAEGKSGKQEVEGHYAAAAVYREHDMEGAALQAEMKAKGIETHLAFLKTEWRRLKDELEGLPY